MFPCRQAGMWFFKYYVKFTLNLNLLQHERLAAILKTIYQSLFRSLTSDIILLISVINDLAALASLGSFS